MVSGSTMLFPSFFTILNMEQKNQRSEILFQDGVLSKSSTIIFSNGKCVLTSGITICSFFLSSGFLSWGNIVSSVPLLGLPKLVLSSAMLPWLRQLKNRVHPPLSMSQQALNTLSLIFSYQQPLLTLSAMSTSHFNMSMQDHATGFSLGFSFSPRYFNFGGLALMAGGLTGNSWLQILEQMYCSSSVMTFLMMLAPGVKVRPKPLAVVQRLAMSINISCASPQQRLQNWFKHSLLSTRSLTLDKQKVVQLNF